MDCSRPVRVLATEENHRRRNLDEVWLAAVCADSEFACVVGELWRFQQVNLCLFGHQGSDPGTVTAYSLNLSKGTLHSDNGALTPTGKSAATGTQPGPLIFDPTNTFAFVADFGNPSWREMTTPKRVATSLPFR